MPLSKILLRPGINTEASQTLNTGGLSSSNLIRFKNGLLQKFGGWSHFSNVPVIGIARGLHSFQDLNGNNYLAVGTNVMLEIYSNGIVSNITPIRKTSTLGAPFTTTSSNTSVKVTDTGNGAVVGDYIIINPHYSINGIVLLGFYQVQTVIDANNYTITAANAATSSGSTGAVPYFTTTFASNSVNVLLNNHGFSVGSVFTMQFTLTLGGLTLVNEYTVNSVVDANNFTILASGSATSGASAFENSGAVRIQYLLHAGPASDMLTQGYGTGGYGLGGYGTTQNSTFTLPLRNWFLDNFGQNLVALPSGGTLYQWVPPIAVGNVATAVSNAPLYGNGMFVAMPQEQVVILGAETGGMQFPLLIRWCDAGNITSWTASITNQAGSFNLSRGSRIIGGCQGPQFGLIWTDIDLWGMNYIQYPLVYGFSIIAEQCGLIAAKAFCLQNNTAYWMSIKGFFQYNASTGCVPIPCTVWDFIFNNLDTSNLSKIFGASNSLFNEVMFFFPSTFVSNPTPGEIDSYVKLNIVDNLWDYGSLVRYSWIDENIFGNPLAVDGSNLIQQHEIGYDADGVAMTGVFAESGYIDISDGTIFIFVDWLIPDFVWATINPATTPSVNITIYTEYTPGDIGPSSVGPFTVTPTTQYISFRTRARQMAIKIESDAIDTFWRIGSIRYRGAQSGRV